MLLFAAGGALYVLFRTRALLMFVLADKLGLSPFLGTIRAAFSHVHLPEFVVFSLPAGFWSGAYVMLMHGLFDRENRQKRLLWASVIPLIGTLSELMQAFRLLPGTFDVADLACYVVPYAVYALISLNNKKTTIKSITS